MNQRSTLSGAEAAHFLGVKRATLYAYASRGLVRSQAMAGTRARRYSLDDLERLKLRHDARSGHGPVAAAALRFGEPVLESAVSAIDARGPHYHGVAAVALARKRVRFEQVAELLWDAEARRTAPAPPWPSPDARVLTRVRALGLLPEHPLVVLPAVVSLMALADKQRFIDDAATDRQRARRIIITLAAAVSGKRATGQYSVAETLARGFGGPVDPARQGLIEAALIVMADHELNASTFAVRVAASAGADLYASVQAGLATLSGPKHGRVADRLMALLDEIDKPSRALEVLRQRGARGEDVPGFGHVLYPDGDPRCNLMLQLARRHAPDEPRLKVLDAFLRAATKTGGYPPPNSDVGLVAIAIAARLSPHGAAALFAVGRAAGWIAHALEQRRFAFVLRPRARYVGPALS